MVDVYAKLFRANQKKIFYEKELKLDVSKILKSINKKTKLVILANPNSPTGLHIKKNEVERLLINSKGCKRIWLDETYIEYAGQDQTLERIAEKSNNIFNLLNYTYIK